MKACVGDAVPTICNARAVAQYVVGDATFFSELVMTNKGECSQCRARKKLYAQSATRYQLIMNVSAGVLVEGATCCRENANRYGPSGDSLRRRNFRRKCCHSSGTVICKIKTTHLLVRAFRNHAASRSRLPRTHHLTTTILLAVLASPGICRYFFPACNIVPSPTCCHSDPRAKPWGFPPVEYIVQP